jgi:transposase
MLSLDAESHLHSLIYRRRFSERQIAAEAGVSRGTVRSRLQGIRGRPAPTVRCGRCGALLTETPCRACRLRLALELED